MRVFETLKKLKARKANAAESAGASVDGMTVRSLYIDAMQSVLADPRKALAEHDPVLSEILDERHVPTASDDAPSRVNT
jgi:hypothetical protein